MHKILKNWARMPHPTPHFYRQMPALPGLYFVSHCWLMLQHMLRGYPRDSMHLPNGFGLHLRLSPFMFPGPRRAWKGGPSSSR